MSECVVVVLLPVVGIIPGEQMSTKAIEED